MKTRRSIFKILAGLFAGREAVRAVEPVPPHITSPEEARDVFRHMKVTNRVRRLRHQAMLDGEPPYSPDITDWNYEHGPFEVAGFAGMALWRTRKQNIIGEPERELICFYTGHDKRRKVE